MSAKKRVKLFHMAPSQQSTGSAIVRFYDPDIQAKDALGRTQAQILAWNNSQLEHCHNYIQVLFPLPEGSPFNWSAPVIDLDTAKAFRTNSELRQRLSRSFDRMLAFYGFTMSINPETQDANKQDTEEVLNEATAPDAANTAETVKEDAKDTRASLATDGQAATLQDSEETSTLAASTTKAARSKSTVQASPISYSIIPGPDWRKLSRHWCVRFNHNHLRITRILRCLRVLGLQKESEAFFVALKRVYDDPAVEISARSLDFWTRAAQRPLHLPPDDMEDECEWLKALETEQEASG